MSSDRGANEETTVTDESGNAERSKMMINIGVVKKEDHSEATSALVSNSVLLSNYNSRQEELGKMMNSGPQRNANHRSSQPAASSNTY